MCDTAPCTPGLVVWCGGKTAACVWWWCWYVAAPDTAPPDIGADLELALALTSIRHRGQVTSDKDATTLLGSFYRPLSRVGL